MITPDPPAGSEHYREGWRHGYEQAAIDRERSAGAVRLVPDTGPPPLDFDLLVRSIVDSRYMWISMENAVDMAVTTARRLVDAGAVRIVADGQPVEVHGSLSAMRRLVHSRGITADERDHDVAVSRPAPPLEGRERDRLREVLDAAGLPRDRGWDDVLLALRALGSRAVPDTGQTREQILQRDITFGEYIIAVCDAIGLPHDSPRAAVVEAIRAAVAAAQAPESPTDSTPKAGRGGSGEAETATGTGQAPDVAAPDLDRWLYETFTRHGTAARWARLDVDDRAYWTRKAAEVRALLGTDTTPEAPDA